MGRTTGRPARRSARRPAGLLAGLLACACLWIGAAQLAAAQATAAGWPDPTPSPCAAQQCIGAKTGLLLQGGVAENPTASRCRVLVLAQGPEGAVRRLVELSPGGRAQLLAQGETLVAARAVWRPADAS